MWFWVLIALLIAGVYALLRWTKPSNEDEVYAAIRAEREVIAEGFSEDAQEMREIAEAHRHWIAPDDGDVSHGAF